MNKIGVEHGKWLGQYNWNFIATFRPHYKLTPQRATSFAYPLLDPLILCLFNGKMPFEKPFGQKKPPITWWLFLLLVS